MSTTATGRALIRQRAGDCGAIVSAVDGLRLQSEYESAMAAFQAR